MPALDKYLTSLSSLSDTLNCEWGVKELSSLEEEVLNGRVSAEESEHFSNNGQIYDWNKETKEYLEIWKIYLAMKLLTPPKLLYKKRLAPSLANLKSDPPVSSPHHLHKWWRVPKELHVQCKVKKLKYKNSEVIAEDQNYISGLSAGK